MTACARSIAATLPSYSALRSFAVGDVAGELDDLVRPAVRVEDRVVGRLQPHLAAAPCRRRYSPLSKVPRASRFQKRRYSSRLGVLRVAEDAVVLAADLVERVADGVEEVLVGRRGWCRRGRTR